jgi:hypothetical protein
MVGPLREACDAPQEVPFWDKASAALDGNPKGTMKMAAIAASLAPYWEQPNRVARALH